MKTSDVLEFLFISQSPYWSAETQQARNDHLPFLSCTSQTVQECLFPETAPYK